MLSNSGASVVMIRNRWPSCVTALTLDEPVMTVYSGKRDDFSPKRTLPEGSMKIGIADINRTFGRLATPYNVLPSLLKNIDCTKLGIGSGSLSSGGYPRRYPVVPPVYRPKSNPR